MPGLEDELFLVPVVVVDVGTVEALNHFGGSDAGFDGLEDAEGDERATQSVVQSLRVLVVTSFWYSLPTCVMRARICAFAAPRAPCRVAIASLASFYVSVSSPAPDCVTFAARMSLPSLSSDCG